MSPMRFVYHLSQDIVNPYLATIPGFEDLVFHTAWIQALFYHQYSGVKSFNPTTSPILNDETIEEIDSQFHEDFGFTFQALYEQREINVSPAMRGNSQFEAQLYNTYYERVTKAIDGISRYLSFTLLPLVDPQSKFYIEYNMYDKQTGLIYFSQQVSNQEWRDWLYAPAQ